MNFLEVRDPENEMVAELAKKHYSRIHSILIYNRSVPIIISSFINGVST